MNDTLSLKASLVIGKLCLGTLLYMLWFCGGRIVSFVYLSCPSQTYDRLIFPPILYEGMSEDLMVVAGDLVAIFYYQKG